MYRFDYSIDVYISLTIYDFVRVLLILYVRFSNRNTDVMCVLIEFKKVERNFDDYIYQSTHEIKLDELHKIFFIDVPFDNMYRNQDDILIQIEDNILYNIPFYYKM